MDVGLVSAEGSIIGELYIFKLNTIIQLKSVLVPN